MPSNFITTGESKENEDDDAPVDRSIYENGISDTRGFYEDGAYIGRGDDWGEESNESWGDEEDEDGEASEAAVLEAYFGAILQQYLHLRIILNSSPPSGTSKRLPSSQATYAAPFGPGSNAIKVWPPLLRNTDPSPVQVSQMSKDTVIRILRIMLGGKFLRRGYPLPERTSRWIWALLARLPERGELNYSEIGWIRDLGRRAVLLGRSLSEMAALREELEEGGLGVNDAVDASSSDEDVVAGEETGDTGGEAVDEDRSATSDGADKNGDAADESEGEIKEDEPEQAQPKVVDSSAQKQEAAGESEGGIEDEEEGDVAMDLESDSDEGEIREGQDAKNDQSDSLEAAKLELLARLQAQAASDEDEEEEEDRLDAVRERSRMNMRATLNMILTVAGEFYGQRDLLEFREPFVGM